MAEELSQSYFDVEEQNETNYEELVDAFKTEKYATDLISMSLSKQNEAKEQDEETLKYIKGMVHAAGAQNELVLNKLSEKTMLAYSFTKYACDGVETDENIKLLKGLEEQEIKIYEEYIQRLEALDQDYTALANADEPNRLQRILDTLKEEEGIVDKQIEAANIKLQRLDEDESDSNKKRDLENLKVVCDQLEKELPDRLEIIKQLEEKNALDREYINTLNEELVQFQPSPEEQF